MSEFAWVERSFDKPLRGQNQVCRWVDLAFTVSSSLLDDRIPKRTASAATLGSLPVRLDTVVFILMP